MHLISASLWQSHRLMKAAREVLRELQNVNFQVLQI